MQSTEEEKTTTLDVLQQSRGLRRLMDVNVDFASIFNQRPQNYLFSSIAERYVVRVALAPEARNRSLPGVMHAFVCTHVRVSF